MFTGLVEHVGSITAKSGSDPMRLTISIPPRWQTLALGSSVAVDGCCLTVVDAGQGHFTAEVGRETYQRTTLAELNVGRQVNLERPLRIGQHLDGHLVLGHVDATAQIRAITPQGTTTYISVEPPRSLMRYIAAQGSITLGGISLTVVQADNRQCQVAIIPHTLAHTSLGQKRVGDAVNIEIDALARYIGRMLAMPPDETQPPASAELTMDFLRSRGFA